MKRHAVLFLLALAACRTAAPTSDEPAIGDRGLPSLEDEELRGVSYRFAADRADFFADPAKFMRDGQQGGPCQIDGPAFERLFLGSTRAEWAQSGFSIVDEDFRVISGRCAAGRPQGAATVVGTYRIGNEDAQEKVVIVGDFGPEGLIAGVRYHVSHDILRDAPEYQFTYQQLTGEKLSFLFADAAGQRTLVDEPVEGTAVVRRRVYEGRKLTTELHLAPQNVRHGQWTSYKDGVVAEKKCFENGEEVDLARCDEGLQLAAASASPAAPAAAKAGWPELTALMKPVGGGENDAAVVIGVQDYAFLADIAGADVNARDWYRYFTTVRQVPAASTRLLLDAEATDVGIRDAVRAMAAQAKPGGTLWVVFIGHGAPAENQKDGLLVGVDAQQTARGLYARSVPQDELIRLTAAGKQLRTTLIVDACFSGQTSSGPLAPGLQPALPVASTVEDRRTLAFSAGASNQFAGPLPHADRPAFSYLMLGSLLGWGDADADGLVTATESIDYVTATLRAVLVGRNQTPELSPRRADELVTSANAPAPDVSAIVLQGR